MVVDATDGDGPLGESATVRITPLQPSGARGVAVTLEPRGDGVFVGDVTFGAPGQARLEIEVTAEDGRRALLSYPVTVARGGA